MKKGVEGFEVSKTTSVMKTTRLNIAHNDDMRIFGEKVKCNGDVSGGESTGSDSPTYEDFVEFDPSTFRLTPQSTISPKRDAGLMNEFKSVDSYDSLMMLSVGESADDLNMYKLDDDDLVVENDTDDGELLPLVQDVMVPVDDDNPKTHVTLVEDFSPSNSDDVDMVDVSLVEDDVNAGNVSFDLSCSNRKGLLEEELGGEVDEIENRMEVEIERNEDYSLVDKETEDNNNNTRDKKTSHEQGEQRDSLDSERLMNYLKNEKMNEICKRLKADLKGTKQYNYEELPLSDQIPFSERVYNYISELKAYSSISSQDRTTSSRLTSLDLKTLQSLDTVDTVDTDERVKDFEQALESQEGQNKLNVGLMDDYKTLRSMGEDFTLEEELRGNTQIDEIKQNSEEQLHEQLNKETPEHEKIEEIQDEKEYTQVDLDMERKNWIEKSKDDEKMSFEMGLKSLKYPIEVEEYMEKRVEEDNELYEKLGKQKVDKNQSNEEQLHDLTMDMEIDVNKDLEMRMNEFSLEIFEQKEVDDRDINEGYRGESQMNTETQNKNKLEYEKVDKQLPKEDIEELQELNNEKQLHKQLNKENWKEQLVKGSTIDSLNYVDDKWYGLECMASNYGVNLVYSCLRSIKIQVGNNLHEYDAYTGTKKMMNKFLELMKKFNGFEKKLRGDFLTLEKNDYTLEATRNSYVTLSKSNNRLKGLLDYYKEYEKLQRDSIKLKSDNIALVRREILNKLSEFQVVSKFNESTDGIEIVENRLNELYDQTGFFVLPLYHDRHSYYDFMYLFNFNYYSDYNLSYLKNKGNRDIYSKDNYSNKIFSGYSNNNMNNNTSNNKYMYQTQMVHNQYNSNVLTNYNCQNQNYYQGQNQFNSYEKKYYSLEAVTPQMLEKLRILEYLPYKPKKVTPDLELKLFMYFQSDSSSSSLSSSSNSKCFVTSNPLSSGSSCSPRLPCLDFLNDDNTTTNMDSSNKRFGNNRMNYNNRDIYSKENQSQNKQINNKTKLGLMGVNVEVDVNKLIDLYSVRNDLKLVLYSPFHKDTTYYRFKLDLVDCFNHLLSLKMSSYVDELTENVQLLELLETLVHFTNELNLKFVYYLKIFNDLLKLSSNHYYLLYDKNNISNTKGGFNYNDNYNTSNMDSSTARDTNNNANSTPYGKVNETGGFSNNNMNNNASNNKVLKLMLTFKNDVPCLWCNVYFNFDYKKDKNKYLQYFNKDFKDGLICGVNFEFVHKLNKSYFETYENTLKKLNETINGVNKSKILVEHIVTTLNSQQYFL